MISNDPSQATLEVRSGSRGHVFHPGPWIRATDRRQRPIVWEVPMIPPALTAAGARVQVLSSPPPGCAMAGYITGVAGLAEGQLLPPDEAAADGSAPRTGAVNAARNEAAKSGLFTITIDAHATLEYHEIAYEKSYLAVYGRAFRCP